MKAYELLDTPAKWVQKHIAVDAKGEVVNPTSPLAVGWCLLGALRRCHPDESDYVDALARLRAKLPPEEGRYGQTTTVWNDHPQRSHAEVLALLKEADV